MSEQRRGALAETARFLGVLGVLLGGALLAVGVALAVLGATGHPVAAVLTYVGLLVVAAAAAGRYAKDRR